MAGSHTPGPWREGYVEGYGVDAPGDHTTTCIVSGRRAPVALVFEPGIMPHNDRRLDANARLIAAAPDLLEALKEAQKLIDEALPKFDWGKSALDGNAIFLLNEVPLKVRAAIAKAESGQ